MESVLSLIATFTQYSKDNPVLAGVISLWGLSTFSYLARNIPMNIFRHIKKQTTTTLTMISTSEAFHGFLEWYNDHGYGKRLRAFKISCGRYGDDKSTKSVGYGSHFFIYGFRPGMITLSQKETHSNMERDQIDIVIFGRKQNIYNRIFEEIENKKVPDNSLIVYKYNESYWEKSLPQRKRGINTVFLNMGVKEKILDFLATFKSRESWYVRNGIPYQTGILLYGPPGCGKTTLVKALASYLKFDLYILPVSKIYDVNKAMFSLPEYSMILIEDLDTDGVTEKREEKANGVNRGATEQSPFTLNVANISDILNTFDGILTNHGRILISTTNHFEKLDEALIRDGRFDLKLKLDYTDNFMAEQFMNNYYTDYKIPKGFQVKEKLPAATVQRLILKSPDSPDKVIEDISKFAG